MKVITLNSIELTNTSNKLAKKILQTNWRPELVIGIKTGGIFVSQPMKEEIEKQYSVLYNEISLSRPSSLKKKKYNINKVLKMMPYFLLDILRNLEVLFFEINKSKVYSSHREHEINIDKKLLEQILVSSTILLVDDAIDTGTTVLALKNRISSIKNNVDIKIATLTSTHKKPYIQPDFSLYNRVLLRCPWAQDYKGEL